MSDLAKAIALAKRANVQDLSGIHADLDSLKAKMKEENVYIYREVPHLAKQLIDRCFDLAAKVLKSDIDTLQEQLRSEESKQHQIRDLADEPRRIREAFKPLSLGCGLYVTCIVISFFMMILLAVFAESSGLARRYREWELANNAPGPGLSEIFLPLGGLLLFFGWPVVALGIVNLLRRQSTEVLANATESKNRRRISDLQKEYDLAKEKMDQRLTRVKAFFEQCVSRQLD